MCRESQVPESQGRDTQFPLLLPVEGMGSQEGALAWVRDQPQEPAPPRCFRSDAAGSLLGCPGAHRCTPHAGLTEGPGGPDATRQPLFRVRAWGVHRSGDPGRLATEVTGRKRIERRQVGVRSPEQGSGRWEFA